MKKLLLAIVVSIAALSAPAQQTKPRFAWGAEMASSIDMTATDMSALGFNAYFGMQAPLVQMLGIGAGVDIPVNNSMNSLPIFMIARSNFCNHSTLCFADLRAGISVNDVSNSNKQTGTYVSGGVGFNLAFSPKFKSYLILAYSFLGRKDYESGEQMVKVDNLHLVTIRFGVSF